MTRESLVGKTLGGYALRGEVGEGGTSAVFRAEHPAHGTVAVKVLREKLRHDKTAVTRFVREARFGERVRHDNVVQTLEVGETAEGLHFLAIEWAKGELLERYVKMHAPLPYPEVGIIVRQIADAGKSIAVGLVDVKNLWVEPVALLVERIQTCLKFAPAESLHVTPDCGFSQTARYAANAKMANLSAAARQLRAA